MAAKVEKLKYKTVEIHFAEAECRHCNRLRGLQRLFQFRFIRDDRHPDAPSASGGLDNYGISNFTRNISGSIWLDGLLPAHEVLDTDC